MNHHRQTTLVSVVMLAVGLWLLDSRDETRTVAQTATDPWARYITSSPPSVRSGTRIKVALGTTLSSETARVGDAWHGTVTENVRTQNQGEIPPGSEVEGVIAEVTRARRGSPAMLELCVQSIRVNGHEESIAASARPLIAGSPGTPHPGAIADGTGADALIEEAPGDGKHAVAAGILDGAASAGVATSKGLPVVLSDGTVMGFTVSRTVHMR